LRLVERRRVAAMILATCLVLAAGCAGSSNAASRAISIRYGVSGEPADAGVAVRLAKCSYSGATITAVGTLKIASEPISVAGLTLSASDMAGTRIATSTTLVRDLTSNGSQHWSAKAFLPRTNHSPPNSCYVEMNEGLPPYPGP
jgi:hypothetical protein